MTFSWPHLWVDDVHRSPVFTFEWQWQSESHTQYFGFYGPSNALWLELTILIVLEACLAALLSVPLYYTVIKPRQQQQEQQNKKQGGSSSSSSSSMLPWLAGYGFFIPFWLVLPKLVMDALFIQHKIARFCMAVISPILFTFRTMAAVHGFLPKHAERSLQDCALYFGSPMILLFDETTQTYISVKSPSMEVLRVLGRYVMFIHLTGLFQSCFVLFPNHFPNLGSTAASASASALLVDNYHDCFSDFLLRLKDNALFAILMQLYLTAYGEGLVLTTYLLLSIQAQPLMNNPMFGSTSPSDFWGRRWNLLIHDCLLNGVYKPVRANGGSKALAVAATFIASGLFHEWLLPIVFIGYANYRHGLTLLFFVWQGALIALEAVMCDWNVFSYLARTLPGPVRTFLIVLLGLPVAHWFSESWMGSDFFVHGRMMLPSVLPLPSN